MITTIKKGVFLLFAICSLNAGGQPVSDLALREKADKFMVENFPGGARKIIGELPYTYQDIHSLTLFELEPEGWILLSSDEKVEPVIGFSFSGHFRKPDENINDPMYHWFDARQKEIKTIIADESLTENAGWKEAGKIGDTKGLSAGTVRVYPFIDVEWDQGRNWNQFCPEDAEGPGGHVYVGCVAVAMAQAMSVYRIPVQGKGYNNYQDATYGTQYVNFGNAVYYWDSMSVSSADKFNSYLLFHCAVAVNMSFGASGSGAQTIDAASALRNYFSFSKKVLYKARTGTDLEWHNLLIEQLLRRRPIIYSGNANDGSPGHAFDIDGIMSGRYFHINWGWSGSNNGYYTLDALNVGLSDFNKNQAAILAIQPFYYPTDVTLSDTVVKRDQPEGTLVGTVRVIDEAADNSYTITLRCDSTYNGSEWVSNYILSGDSLKTGRVFRVTDGGTDTIYFSVKDKFNNSINKMLVLQVGDIPTWIHQPEAYENGLFDIYPNPASDNISFYQESPIDIISLKIYTISGTLVKSIRTQGTVTGIQISSLSEGLYILEAEMKNHSLVRRKFIKR